MASSGFLSQDRPASSGGAVRAAVGDAATTNEGLAQMELDGQPPSGALGAGVAPSSPREQGGSAAGSQEEEFADAGAVPWLLALVGVYDAGMLHIGRPEPRFGGGKLH